MSAFSPASFKITSIILTATSRLLFAEKPWSSDGNVKSRALILPSYISLLLFPDATVSTASVIWMNRLYFQSDNLPIQKVSSLRYNPQKRIPSVRQNQKMQIESSK
jgi:hypothetical protein